MYSVHMSATTRDTVKLLVKSIVNRLENQKSIEFSPRLRQIIQEELTTLIGPLVLTEGDIREKALAKMGARSEMLQDSGFTESEQYRAAKGLAKEAAGDDELNGFYFQKPLKSFAESICQYLMRSSHIDEVFETDDDLIQKIVDIVKRFDASEAH